MLASKAVPATQKIKPSVPTISIIEANGISEQIVALITHHFQALALSTANIDQLQESLSKRLCAELMASVGVSVVEGDGKYESERVQAFLKPPSLKAICGRYFARFWLHEDSVIFNKNPFNSAIAPNGE